MAICTLSSSAFTLLLSHSPLSIILYTVCLSSLLFLPPLPFLRHFLRPCLSHFTHLVFHHSAYHLTHLLHHSFTHSFIVFLFHLLAPLLLPFSPSLSGVIDTLVTISRTSFHIRKLAAHREPAQNCAAGSDDRSQQSQCHDGAILCTVPLLLSLQTSCLSQPVLWHGVFRPIMERDTVMELGSDAHPTSSSRARSW